MSKTTREMDLIEASAASRDRGGPRAIKLLLFLASAALSATAFLAFDFSYSAAIQHARKAGVEHAYCRTPDPVRHHALKPNCATVAPWGEDSYEFLTNSLGFRDEKVRQVPLTDARPRILLLGDSFTEGEIAWRDSYVGRIAKRCPQYDFLDGGVAAYSPSNYLNTARMLLAATVEFDEVIVFIGMGDVQDEAALYHDVDASGAVAAWPETWGPISWYAKWRSRIARHLLLSNDIVGFCERFLVAHGYYYLAETGIGDPFDMERSAWSYRKVNETDSYPSGYGPLGMEGGISKEKAKMTLLWRELNRRNIPISVVVFPWPAQIVHDTADSPHVRIWREWCEGKCKRFMTVFPAFFAVKDHCLRTQAGCWYLSHFIFGDFHYNAAGNALVADAVIKSLEKDPPTKHSSATLSALGGGLAHDPAQTRNHE